MEEDINLRAIIETLIEGKWIISTITAIAVIISGLYSFFVITPMYEAEATIMINQSTEQQSAYLDGYVNEMLTPKIYAERFKSPGLIKNVIEKGNFTDSGWTVAGLRSALNVELLTEGNLIRVKLKGQDPEQVTQIVNIVVEESKNYTAHRIGENINNLVVDYEKQMKIQQTEINQAISEYNELKAGSGLPSLILLQEATSTVSTAGQAPQLLLEANKELLDELGDLDKNKQVEFMQINSKINKLTEIYNNVYMKYEEARSISPVRLAKNKIYQIAEAVVPDQPVSSNKVLILAVATVIGLMFGVFVVYFRAYWKSSDVKPTNIS